MDEKTDESTHFEDDESTNILSLPDEMNVPDLSKSSEESPNSDSINCQEDDISEARGEDELVKVKAKIQEWAKEHYTDSPATGLVRDNVDRHYVEFSNENNLIICNSAVFKSNLQELFPGLKDRKVGKGEYGRYYYQGMDIKKSSPYFAAVSKHRVQIGAKYNQEKQMKEDERKKHKRKLMEWLEVEYESDPPVCLLRQQVYQHYLDFCKHANVLPFSPAIFGKVLLEKFQQLSMRRLGARGQSKYYYMGINIRTESKNYDKVVSGRIVCSYGKPKCSRV